MNCWWNLVRWAFVTLCYYCLFNYIYVYTLNLFLTYDDSGQLFCILCDSVVRSEAVWNIHINSKKHRENIAHVKRKREDVLNCVQPSLPQPLKRPAQTEVSLPPKKLKGECGMSYLIFIGGVWVHFQLRPSWCDLDVLFEFFWLI